MKWRILVFLVCATVICSGCAGGPAPVLPSAYGPLEPNTESVQQVERISEKMASMRVSGRFTIPELRVIARSARLSPVAVSRCDLKVIKIFVSSNWAPVVILRPPVGPRRIWVVVGYDDSTKEFALFDPIDHAEAKMEYTKFFAQWDEPQKTCILVFSRYVGENSIREVLREHLPEKRVSSIPIRTPRDRP